MYIQLVVCFMLIISIYFPSFNWDVLLAETPIVQKVSPFKAMGRAEAMMEAVQVRKNTHSVPTVSTYPGKIPTQNFCWRCLMMFAYGPQKNPKSTYKKFEDLQMCTWFDPKLQAMGEAPGAEAGVRRWKPDTLRCSNHLNLCQCHEHIQYLNILEYMIFKHGPNGIVEQLRLWFQHVTGYTAPRINFGLNFMQDPNHGLEVKVRQKSCKPW